MTPAPVGAADGPALAALHAACFPPAERWGADAITLMLDMPGAFGLTVAGEGFVLARAAAREAEILTLAVRPACRRLGVGAALMQAAISQAAGAGATTVFLEVGEANAAARGLYASLGFSAVGRRPRYYASGGDALVLRYDLRE